jgi:hypothetical protein
LILFGVVTRPTEGKEKSSYALARTVNPISFPIKIKRDRDHCPINQTLLETAEIGFWRTSRDELHILLGIKAEMAKY